MFPFIMSVPLYVLYPEAFRCRRSFCLLKPSRSSWSQTKHRKKMCPSVLLVVYMHMHGCSSVGLFVLSPSSLRCLWQECNVFDFLLVSLFLRSILPLCRPAIYDATQELQGRMGREGDCPLIFSPHFLNYPLHHPSSPPPPPPPNP